MKKILTYLILLSNVLILNAQIFEGVLTYKTNVNVHFKEEINLKFENPNKRKTDTIEIKMNDSTFTKRLTEKKKYPDSIKIALGKNKIKKTYFQKNKIEYIFNFITAKKITHSPKYECIDTTQIQLVDYKDRVKLIQSDSTFLINGQNCNKLEVVMSNYYHIDLFLVDSEYQNQAAVFIYEINNNLLFQNLYFLKDVLEYKKIIKLKYYVKPNNVDYEYILSSSIEKKIENEFILPKYEYCLWDIYEDKKLMKKHKKKKRLERKNKQ